MRASARISPARAAAFDVLVRVATRDSYAAELLHSNLLARLNTADRGLATELVMGVLRWQQKLDHVLESAGGKSLAKFDPEVQVALRLGAYQRLFLDRIPAHAAVSESVELVKLHGKRSAAPLVNAVLRKLPAKCSECAKPSSAVEIAEAYSHPQWLIERWMHNYGREAACAICSYDQQRPKTTIRFHGSRRSNVEELAREHIELEPASIVTAAWHVVHGDITQTTLYRERRLSIQDEGSQLVALLAQGNRILDCCAAPGGKSAVASEQNPSALIVAMDLHIHRARLLRDLIQSRTVLVADARQLPFSAPFDCVVADLPCTGTGTLGRNPEIKWRLNPDDIPRLAGLQLQILDSVCRVAKRLVFSICSLEPEEGEEIVRNFLSDHPEFQVVPLADRLQELARQNAIHAQAIDGLLQGDFLRTIPGVHPCDGFFAAILEPK
jgi:16S rRNA (cytosine967-C5)-methyltransferase